MRVIRTWVAPVLSWSAFLTRRPSLLESRVVAAWERAEVMADSASAPVAGIRWVEVTRPPLPEVVDPWAWADWTPAAVVARAARTAEVASSALWRMLFLPYTWTARERSHREDVRSAGS